MLFSSVPSYGTVNDSLIKVGPRRVSSAERFAHQEIYNPTESAPGFMPQRRFTFMYSKSNH